MRHVGLRQQRVHLVERQERRKRGPRAGRLQIVGRALLEALARGRESGRSRGSRRPPAPPTAATARASPAARTNASSARRSSASDVGAGRCGKRGERGEVAAVALERVRARAGVRRGGDRGKTRSCGSILDYDTVFSPRFCRYAPAFEVAVSSDRSHQSRHAGHRQARRRPTSSKACCTRIARCSRPCSARRTASPSAST